MITGLYAELTHSASCPEISPLHCAEAPIADHYHDQSIGWMRGGPQFNLGLGRGFQVMVATPLDLKLARVSYLLEDGQEFTPSYAGIHHRDETLFGASDARLGFRWFGWAHPNLLIGGGIASSLPFGKTEEDPFQLGGEGLEHQHFQRGTGTFIPNMNVNGIWTKGKLGIMVETTARLSLYENQRGYRPGSGLSWSLGPTFQLEAPVAFYLSIEGSHDGRDQWGGAAAPSSGRHALLSGLNAMYMVSPNLVLQAQVKTTFWQYNLSSSDDDQLIQKFIGSIGFSWTARPKEEHGH
jgi:hypothetical protein